MIRIINLLAVLILCNASFAMNPFWVHTDKKLIAAIVNLDKDVEKYFKNQHIQKCDTTKTNLGFGWKIWEPGIGGGYSSISATFIYHNDSIVSYSIAPYLPEEKRLIRKYKSWYKKSFAFSTNDVLPYIFHAERIRIPLKEYKENVTKQILPSDKILDYMNPFSSIRYGYNGGYGIPVLPNRIAFNSIKDSLTNEQVFLLMHSSNPASRLTAIEYYLTHKDNFSKEPWIDVWIEKNFKEIPKIEIMMGCVGEDMDTETAVLLCGHMSIK